MTELTAQTLDDAIDRYLRSKSKGGTNSGTYHHSARTALDRWHEGLAPSDVGALVKTDAGAGVMRRYVQHLTERVSDDGNGRQQFWDPEIRDQFHHWIDERTYEAIAAASQPAAIWIPRPPIFIHDAYPGGVGLAWDGYDRID
jgi:hypothetical protein